MKPHLKAIVVRDFGGADVLKLEEVPTPVPTTGQVLVQIKAAGVNPADTYMRSGTYSIKPNLPYTPGTDGAGIVDSVGDGVTKVKPGDRVYTARTLTGTYAEYALALESQVWPLPDRVTFSQGAAVYVPYATAFHALHHFAHARGGESVLVHGASGGAGIAAVQIARAMGLTVLGTAGSDKGLELVKREGARHVFNHRDPNYREAIMEATGGSGANVILEMLANVNLGHDLKMLALHGRVVVIGSRGDVTITPRDLMGRDGAIFASSLWNVSEPDYIDLNAGIIAGLENGTLRPVIRKEYPLAEAARAHKEIVEPGSFGKIVLIP